MIAYLKGKSLQINEKSLILEVNNVGYLVRATAEVTSNLMVGKETELFIHTHVREDEITFYGFVDQESLVLFQQLTSVSGVGPKTALDILENPINLIKNAILSEDEAIISQFPRIGKKTAQRLIIDLKNKITPPQSSSRTHPGKIDTDAVEALENLGYDRSIIIKCLSSLPKETKKTEEIIKYFLKNA
ncbi:MAG TPA: Holliday junction branch migration protein RuvA [Candidatus Peregrinibacteria bacterium]|nr:Holliday junction branch migration protein RuvA [Candidatus Peregrinibacteria bacterium]